MAKAIDPCSTRETPSTLPAWTRPTVPSLIQMPSAERLPHDAPEPTDGGRENRGCRNQGQTTALCAAIRPQPQQVAPQLLSASGSKGIGPQAKLPGVTPVTQRHDLLSIGLIWLIAALVWLPALNWGLPTRGTDAALFGDRRPWTGHEILAHIASGTGNHPRGAERGADVDANPIRDRSRPTVLNDTDAKRAEIVRRYRLMSGQPDEFIQFKALAEMTGRSGLSRLDPRLYQYGGLWIYPVGGLVRGAMAVGLIERPPASENAMAWYLDRPEAFGRFYIVARAYSAAWGFVALAAIFTIARRMGAAAWLAAAAALLFALMPVVRTATHEAKPHLAGAALALWAIVAAGRYVEGSRRRSLLVAGLLCGAAAGMVVSMVTSVVALPAAWWLRRRAVPTRPVSTGDREEGRFGDVTQAVEPSRAIALVAAGLVAIVVYAVSNPFVLYNAVAAPELLQSNLGNSTAMYDVGGVGSMALSTVRIAWAGVGAVGLYALFVAIGLIAMNRAERRSPMRMIAGVVGLVAFMQFVVLSAGKPAEYARFGLLAAAVGSTLVADAVQNLLDAQRRALLGWVIAGYVIVAGVSLARNGVRHADQTPPVGSAQRIAVAYEPAPWSCPPIDLFKTELVLMPSASIRRDFDADLLVFPKNLSSQLGMGPRDESCDWHRADRFGFRAR